MLDESKQTFSVLLSASAGSFAFLYTNEHLLRALDLSAGVKVVKFAKVIRFDDICENISSWKKPMAMAGCTSMLAIAADDKCVRVISVQDIMAKQSTTTSIIVKRPASEKLNGDEKKRKKGESEKPLFSIVGSRVFY